jgi:hypothetical protein
MLIRDTACLRKIVLRPRHHCPVDTWCLLPSLGLSASPSVGRSDSQFSPSKWGNEEKGCLGTKGFEFPGAR